MIGWLALACSGEQEGDATGVEPDIDAPVNPPTEPGPTPPTAEDCPALLEATVAEGASVLEQRISVVLEAPGAAWATCEADGDPTEQHLVESTADATEHELVVRGLLGDAPYTCTVRGPCGGADAVTLPLTTGAPTGLPRLTAKQNPSLPMFGAYTLFNDQRGCLGGDQWVVIVDPEGRVRWFFPVGDDYVADIDATLIDAQTIHYGGGWGLMSDGASNRGTFVTMDLSGEVLWERSVPDFGLGFNHHSEPLADGTFLSITGHLDVGEGRDWHGVGLERWDPELGVVWSWDSQALVDSGIVDVPSTFDEDLPYHANAVSLHTDALGEAMWVSNFGEEALWRIDVATGELTHVFGHDGDFTLVDPSGEPLPDAEYPYVQHGPDYADDRVLVYDNGDGRPGGSYSRVAEYTLDLETNTATLNWTWTEPGWFNPIVGDADYLPNGHVLVAQGFVQCLQFLANDVTEIVEIEPVSGDVAWRLTWPDERDSLYRAQRYEGCDVFGNAKYCPAVAERIAELSGSR